MTPVTPAPAMALTARAFLFDTRHDAVERVTQALYDHGAVAQLGEALARLSWRATRLVCRRLAETTADLVDVDLADMVAAGWQKYTGLANAAWETVDRPGSEKLVDLAGHRIACVRRPQVDVFVDDVLVGSVQFELKSELVVGAVVARVSEGRLTAVESGRCRLSVSLSWLEATIAEHEAEVELGAVLLGLEAGVLLVPVPHHPAWPGKWTVPARLSGRQWTQPRPSPAVPCRLRQRGE